MWKRPALLHFFDWLTLNKSQEKLSCQKKSKGFVRNLKIDLGHSMIVSIHFFFTLDWLTSWINNFMLNLKRIINNYDIDPNVIVKTWNLIVIKENINMFVFFYDPFIIFFPFSFLLFSFSIEVSFMLNGSNRCCWV